MSENNNKIDFLAIGDIVVDCFIKLKDGSADVVGTPDTPDYKICIPFGEKVPYEDVFVIPAVGNAANAAMAAVSELTNAPDRDIAEAASRLAAVPGRYQVIHRRPDIVVDYAHTPNRQVSA